MKRASFLMGLAVIAGAGCAPRAADPSLGYEACWTTALREAEARCGRLTVPGSYEAAGRPDRQVAFAVKPPLGQTVGDPIPAVFLIGGPGLSGTYYSEIDGYEASDLDFLNEGRELILVDYRGLGESRPLADCEPSPDLGPCSQALDASGLGPELRSATIARDVDRLLEALGHSRVVLYGESWGTRLALTMMRDVPERISHVVLDGVFPPEVGLAHDPVAALASLDHIARSCEQSAECGEALGDIRRKITDLGGRWADREDVAQLFAGISAVSHVPAAPLLVHELWSREADEAAAMAAEIHARTHETFEDSPVDQAESFLMMITLVCAEEANLLETHAPFDPSPYGFGGPFLELILGHTYGAPVTPAQARSMCAGFDVDAAPEIEVAPVFSDIPTLLLSGGMDMDTSIEWGEIAASRLSNARHLVFPFSGHVTAMSDPCSRSIAAQFVRDPDGTLALDCLDEETARSRRLVLVSPDILEEVRRDIPSTLSTGAR